jgi:sulfopyruvate decarboxylase TPP-binding subunit
LKNLSDTLTDTSWADFRHLAHALTPLLWGFGLGSMIGAVILSFVAYRVSLTMVIAHRRHLENQAQGK